jgi:phosphoglucomutase
MDSHIQAAAEAWLNEPVIAEPDKQEIQDLLDRGDDTELTDRFYQELEFGTGGLRGVIGAGLNRMNIYTVGAAAQGLADYIAEQGEAAKEGGVVVAFDCRRMSEDFAMRTASVMAGNGIAAYVFDRLRPTPELSFAVRHLGCTAGVVITASHNPPQYNGFKAYWTDGGQVTPPHDEKIIERVRQVGGFGNVQAMDPERARAEGLLKTVGSEVDEAFLQAVHDSCLHPEACHEQGDRLKVVFTALHGTGGVLIPEALRRRGFEHIIEVPEQAEPDGEFSTVDSPNPEEGAALSMGIELAKQEDAHLVIGTDPDADRVGIAVRRADGEFELVSGNRIGALLCYYICEQLARRGEYPPDPVVLSTIVSSDMMKEIARSYEAEVVETLTGFKWIGRKMHEYDVLGTPASPAKQFVFGAEESYGYLPVRFVRDKDAVTSAAFIAEMAAWAATEDKTLLDVLDELFQRFGYYHEGAKSIALPGKKGAAKIKSVMDRLRKQPPREIGGFEVAAAADIMTGKNKDLASGKIISRYDVPPADVLIFTLADGGKVIARPSGTEPKIKFYILLKEPADDLEEAKRSAVAKVDTIVAQLTQLVK